MTSTDSVRPSATVSPSELVEAIEGQAAKLARMISAQLEHVLLLGITRFARDGDGSSFDGVAQHWSEFIEAEVVPQIAATYELGAVLTVTAATEPFPGEFSEGAYEWARAASRRLQDMGRDAQSQMYWLVAQAIEEGLTPAELAAKLQHQIGMTEGQAGTVARTELMSAFTNGDRAWADALPTRRRPSEHSWVAVMDEATRPDHAEAHNQTVPFRVPFSVGGAYMLHPHVPGAPAEQVVNCRCVEVMLWPGDTRPDGSVVGG